MKYLKIIITFFYFFYTSSISAQDYIPMVVEGNTVKIDMQDTAGPGEGSFYFNCWQRVTCETVDVNGFTYNLVKNFALNEHTVNDYCHKDIYLREDTDLQKVYFLDEENEEHLLVDYLLEAGDTMTFWGPSSNQTITVDTVYYEEYLGQLRKIIAYGGLDWPEYKYIEGVGHSMEGMALPKILWKFATGNTLGDCDDDDDFFLSSNLTLSEDRIFNIYPNPSSGYLYMGKEENNDYGPSDYELKIYDMQGKVLFEKEYHGYEYRVDMRSFPKGILLATLKTRDTYVVEKIINE